MAIESVARRMTAEGVGGVQVIELIGPLRSSFVSTHFQRVSRQDSGQLAFGRLHENGEIVDEVLLQELGDSLRLCLHGGRVLEERVMQLAQGWGFEIQKSGSASESDSIEKETLRALTSASSIQAVLFLAGSSSGILLREIKGLIQVLANHGGCDGFSLSGAKQRLTSLLQRAPFGMALLQPPTCALLGPPNAGKSTLFNALVGSDRSLVQEIAGTTRDVVEAQAEWCGYPFVVADTAGLREAASATERVGVLRAEAKRQTADIRIWLSETGDTFPEDSGPGDLCVVTKIDEREPADVAALKANNPDWLFVSGTERLGLQNLKDRVIFRSVFSGPAIREFPCPFTERQRNHLERALASVDARPIDAIEELRSLIG